ncbi:MAG: WecB/TagA/CpsF family glycosyltransferase [Actinomycetes bacterium]
MRPTSSARTDPGAKTYLCCGVRIDALSPKAAREALIKSAWGASRSVHLCNAYTLSLAVRQPIYRQLLNESDLNLADGQPVAFVGRRLGHAQLRSSVRGPALLLDTLDRGQSIGLRHYFYGSTPEVCKKLLQEVDKRFPAATIVGLEAPPFRQLAPNEAAEVVRRIRSAEPDIVWVGLGTPRQDEFLRTYRDQIDCTMVAIGAGFDFLAGTKRVAPRWVQAASLEWMFRLGTEPRRLWKRYLIGNPVFIFGLILDLASRQRRRRPAAGQGG